MEENIIIKTAHEESYSDSKSLGVLINYKTYENTDIVKKYDSLIYIYHNESDDPDNGKYIFFDTIIDMNDYLLYGSKKIKRAYMKEIDFDYYYDNGLNNPFTDVLNWIE